MNSFEHLIGKKIIKILRLDIKGDYELDFTLALFLQLDNESGLLIGNDFEHDNTTIGYMTLQEVRDDYGIEWFETCLNELKPIDQLNDFVGQNIQSIKVGQFNEDKWKSDNFIITSGHFAGLIIEANSQKMTLYTRDKVQRILINSNLLFPNPSSWVLI